MIRRRFLTLLGVAPVAAAVTPTVLDFNQPLSVCVWLIENAGFVPRAGTVTLYGLVKHTCECTLTEKLARTRWYGGADYETYLAHSVDFARVAGSRYMAVIVPSAAA